LFLLIPAAMAHIPLDVGDWTVTELHAGPAAEGGHWFEMLNNDESDGNNLKDIGFLDVNGTGFEVESDVVAHAGEYVVLASEDSTVEADYRYDGTVFTLPVEAGEIVAVDPDREVAGDGVDNDCDGEDAPADTGSPSDTAQPGDTDSGGAPESGATGTTRGGKAPGCGCVSTGPRAAWLALAAPGLLARRR
jgi:hypothetical protein